MFSTLVWWCAREKRFSFPELKGFIYLWKQSVDRRVVAPGSAGCAAGAVWPSIPVVVEQNVDMRVRSWPLDGLR